MTTSKVDHRIVLLLAGEADLDPRTVEGFFGGNARVQRATRRVIVDAATRLGLAHILPSAEPATAA